MASAALREAQEEIGLDPSRVRVFGYLPDHIVISGFRVTPVLSLVTPPFTLDLNPAEVAGVFEVPVGACLRRANHQARMRRVGDEELLLYDIPWEGQNIWGATAGMLLTFMRMVEQEPGMVRNRMRLAGRALARLLEVMRRLRDPQGGCPWDREQDFASIAPFTIEEAYEVAEAIAQLKAGADPGALEGELGDLLFQVVFHAQMGSERQWFDFASVANAIADKLIARHPHVFADAASGSTARPESRLGRTQGARTRRQDRHAERTRRCPAGAAGAGACRQTGQTRGPRGLRLAGCHGACAPRSTKSCARSTSCRPATRERRAEELGDLLFAAANWARHQGLDPGGSAASCQCQVRTPLPRHGRPGANAWPGTQEHWAPKPGTASGTR